MPYELATSSTYTHLLVLTSNITPVTNNIGYIARSALEAAPGLNFGFRTGFRSDSDIYCQVGSFDTRLVDVMGREHVFPARGVFWLRAYVYVPELTLALPEGALFRIETPAIFHVVRAVLEQAIDGGALRVITHERVDNGHGATSRVCLRATLDFDMNVTTTAIYARCSIRAGRDYWVTPTPAIDDPQFPANRTVPVTTSLGAMMAVRPGVNAVRILANGRLHDVPVRRVQQYLEMGYAEVTPQTDTGMTLLARQALYLDQVDGGQVVLAQGSAYDAELIEYIPPPQAEAAPEPEPDHTLGGLFPQVPFRSAIVVEYLARLAIPPIQRALVLAILNHEPGFESIVADNVNVNVTLAVATVPGTEPVAWVAQAEEKRPPSSWPSWIERLDDPLV